MKIGNFVSWCFVQGILSPLEIKHRGDGSRYVVMNANANANAKGMASAMAMSETTTTSTTRLISCPMAATLTASDRNELADRLLFERKLGAQSLYAPYIDVLPTLESFQDMPRFWEESRFDLVSSSDGGLLLEAVKQQQQQNIMTDVSNPWALACVDTRANYLPDMSFAMTPLLDMVNHNPTVKTTAKVEDGFFSLDVASESIETRRGLRAIFQPPPEVCISYGELDNLQTLVQYGFVSKNHNPYNEESFPIALMGQTTPIMATVMRDGKIDPMALGMLRRALATTEELDLIEGPMIGYLSARNEVEVYALIAGFLEEAIYDATTGNASSNNNNSNNNDALVTAYLSGRATTLQRGLDKILLKFPDILG